jgi:hypothetical protein
MKTLFLLLALAVAGLGYYWVTRSFAPEVTAQPVRNGVTQAKRVATPAPVVPAPAKQAAITPAPAVAPPEAIAAECLRVLTTGSPAERQLAFADLLNRTRDEAGYRAILDVFARLYKEGRRNGPEWIAFWSELVARDPVAAAALSQNYNSDPKWQAGVAGLLVHEWALRDPAAAIAWLDANTSLTGKDLDMATLALLSGYAERDVRAASAYALSVIKQDDPLFGDMAYVLSTTALNKGGKEGLFNWFDQLPNDELKHRLFPSVSNRLERISMQERASWLTAQAGSSYRNDQAYRDFARAWAKEEPATALGWVFSLARSPHDGTQVGVGYASFQWLQKDIAEFHRHYQTLPQAQQAEIVRAIKLATADPKFPNPARQAGLSFLDGLR